MMESRMESTCGRVKTMRRFCPHCEDFVTKSTFYRHKSKFFDKHTKTSLARETIRKPGIMMKTLDAWLIQRAARRA